MGEFLGYLGPPGTFSEEAAIRYCTGQPLLSKPYFTINQIFSAVENGEVKMGVVPVENSLEGSVNLTLDLLSGGSQAKVAGELLLRVQHCLLTRPGEDITQIKEIYSHPQALAQCRTYLYKFIPEAELISMISTAEAAELVGRSEGKAVIASRRAAELYSLDIVRENIQDEPSNITRFLLLAMEDAPWTGLDKTSLLIGLDDRPGSLHAALGVFACHDLNLTKIESRPLRGTLGKYKFFLDLEGHRKDLKVSRALEEVQEKALCLKILGSYPVARQTLL
ncbi:MAG: prephenate dehydratase [Bacillota bacterium]